MCERDSELNRELLETCENPGDFDFGFAEKREASGFANFDFDPAEAKAMRQSELDRIRDAQDGQG